MNDRKVILLTGGTGFIGKNLVESCLSIKYRILAPTHKELDLLDAEAVRAYIAATKPDSVIHSACKPGHRNAKDPSGLFYSNTRMFFNLAANSGSFRKMIVLGSGAIYDMRHYQPKMREEYFGANIPADDHGFSRYVCGKYMENAPNIVDLRIFGVFGKYEDYGIRFISNMICKALYDLPLTIKQNRKMDYVLVDDLVPVLEHFLNNDAAHKAYNVTPDRSIELIDIARQVLRIAGKDLPIKTAQPGFGPEYSGDNSRLRSEIKELFFTPEETAIEKLYSWYAANKKSINRELLLSDK